MLAALIQPGISTSNQVMEYFGQGVVVKPERFVAVEGFHLGDHGWYLDPGASGRLVYRVPGFAGTRIGVNLWIYLPDGITNAIDVGAPGLPTVRVASNVKYFGARLPLPAQYASASSLDVQIEAINASSVRREVLDELVTYSIHGDDPRAPPFYSFLAFGGLVGLLGFFAIRRRPRPVAVATGIGLVATIAAASRVSALFVLNLPTDPDAVGYRSIADRFQWWPPFDNGIFGGNSLEREPLFPMIAHIYFQLIGSSDFHLRVVSATLSVAVVIVSMVAARRRLKTWWAPVLVGVLVAISGPLIQESDRGLRLELETLLILGLYLALDRNPARRPFLDAALIGLLGAAMALARTYFIPVFLVAVAISFLVRYRPLSRVVGLIVVATLIMGGAEAAHRVGMYENRQNAFWDSAKYMRWNANEELYRFHRPLPDPDLFPTLQQYQQEGTYAGPPITGYQYFFVIHSPVEFARDSLAGTNGIFNSMDSFIFDVRAAVDVHKFPERFAPIAKSLASHFDLVLRWIVLLGLMAMCVRALREPLLIIIPTIVVTWLGMTAFLFNHGLVEEYRHTWQTYPLALIAGGWLLEKVALYLAPRFRLHRVVNAETALFTASMVLTPASFLGPSSVRYATVAVVAALVAALAYRRPAWGISAALLSVAAGAGLVGAAAALAAAAAIAFRTRPPVRPLWPLLALVPVAVAMVVGGGVLSVAGIEVAAVMVGLVAGIAMAAREASIRDQLLWLLAAVAPLAGVTFFLHPSAPGAVELAPIGVVAAAWLYLKGHRVALALGLMDLALVVLVEPLATWIAVAVVLAWLAIQAGRVPRSRRLVLAGGLAAALAALTAGASLAATTPPPTAAWSTQLDSPASSVRQDITVDRAGDTSLWFYARRSTALTDYPFTVLVNGTPVTTDLNSVLPTDVMTWNRIPLDFAPRVGERLEVQVVATGSPNPVNRYLELGGDYATVDGISSPGVDGTYLIVLGDDSMPLAPNGLPEPMVRNRLQPPMGAWMPGELSAPTESRQEAGVLQIWQQALAIAVRQPFGVGTGHLGTALHDSGVGLGPGLTARSQLLQALGEWGFVGLTGLLLLLAVAGWLSWRSGDRLAMALLGLGVITMLGESLLAEPAAAATLWLAVGFCFGAISSREAARSTSPASDGEMRPETSPREAIHAG
jgi:MYXO-CTERM domain-containing protein